MIAEQIEYQARWLVDHGRSSGEPDDIIRLSLMALKKFAKNPMAKVAIQRVINDMKGNDALKIEKGSN